MKLTHRIETRAEQPALFYRLTGDYSTADYGKAWGKIAEYCIAHKLDTSSAEAEYINLYLDHPKLTPAEQCRVDVCVAHESVGALQPSDEVGIRTIEGGRFIVFLMRGPYSQIGEAYQTIEQTLPQCGVELRPCPMFEKYLNSPETTKPEDLLTEFWFPIA